MPRYSRFGERYTRPTPAFELMSDLAPEYIGYSDLAIADGMLHAHPARIEERADGFFKYRPDFAT